MIQLQIPSQWLLSYTSSFKNWVTWEIETEVLQIRVKKCLSLLRDLQKNRYWVWVARTLIIHFISFFFFSILEAGKSKMKILGGLGFSEESLPDLRKATLSLCTHMGTIPVSSAVSSSFIRTPVLPDQGFVHMSSFDLNNLLMGPISNTDPWRFNIQIGRGEYNSVHSTWSRFDTPTSVSNCIEATWECIMAVEDLILFSGGTLQGQLTMGGCVPLALWATSIICPSDNCPQLRGRPHKRPWFLLVGSRPTFNDWLKGI